MEHVGGDRLDHGNLLARLFFAVLVHLPRRVEHQPAGLIDLHARLGDPVLDHPLVCQHGTVGETGRCAFAHEVQGALRAADGPHAMVNAPGSQPGLSDGKSVALLPQQVGGRHAHVPVQHLAMAMAAVVVEDRHGPHHFEPWGIHGHQDLARAPMLGCVGIGDHHGNDDLAVGMSGIGGEPLVPVDDIIVPVANRPGLEQGGVRTGRVGLGHGKAGSDFALQQGFEPLILLLRSSVFGQNLHVARVGR